MNVITAAAAYVDFCTGIYILKKIPISLSPSIRAASIISIGKFLEFCLNIMMRNGVEIAGSMKPHTVFIKPSFDIKSTMIIDGGHHGIRLYEREVQPHENFCRH